MGPSPTHLLSILLAEREDPVYLVGVDGRLLHLNPAAARLLRASPGAPMAELHPPGEARAAAMAAHSAAVADGRLRRVDTTLRCDGTARRVQVDLYPVRDDAGGVAAVCCICRDPVARDGAASALQTMLLQAEEIGHVGSWDFDLRANRLSWSRETYRILGLDPAVHSPSYDAYLAVVHPDDRAAVDGAWSESLAGSGEGYEIEHRILCQGEVRVLHVKCLHVRAADGTVVRSLGMVQDVTARKRIEENLRHEREAFVMAIETAPVALLMADSAGRIVLVNRVLTSMFGYAFGELIGEPVERLLPPQARQRHVAAREDFVAAPHPRQMGMGRELHGLRRDGSLIEVEVGISHFDGEGGRFVLATVVDVTERRRSMADLAEREQRYRSVVETTPDGFWISDMDSRLLAVNDAYCRLSGYSRAQLLTMSISELEVKESAADTAAHIARVERDGHDRFDTVHRRRDGSVWPVEITVSINRELGELVVFARDLTRTHVLESERANAVAALRDMAFRDALTGMPNRRMLVERLGQAISASRRHGRHGALLFVDLDHFKDVNDNLGHEMGDMLLIQVGARLAQAVREEDTVARIGGDEFVVLLPELAERRDDCLAQLAAVAAKLDQILEQPYLLGHSVYHGTQSIGGTTFGGDDPLETVLGRADAAMYQVKRASRAS